MKLNGQIAMMSRQNGPMGNAERAFSSSAEEQKLMAEATKRLTAGTSAHGNPGEASVGQS